MTHLLCTRCLLRSRNIRTISAYDSPSPLQSQRQPPPPPASQPPCSACLGVLQERALTQITTMIQPLLHNVTHDDALFINAAFPPALAVVRDRAFSLSHPSSASTMRKEGSVTGRGTTPSSNTVSLREALKWTLASRLQRIFNLRYCPNAQLFLNVSFQHPCDPRDTAPFTAADPANFTTAGTSVKRRRHAHKTPHDSTGHITRVAEAMNDEKFRQVVPHLFPFPPPPAEDAVEVAATLSVATAHVSGYYNKFSRIVSQTPWFVEEDGSRGKGDGVRNGEEDGGGGGMGGEDGDMKDGNEMNTSIGEDFTRVRKTALSVEDVVLSGVRQVISADRMTFSGGGREDVDVRMLGNGRPFLVEIVNPRIIPRLLTATHTEAMTKAAHATSTSVSVRALRIVDRSHAAKTRAAETDKRKHYRCVVWASRNVSKEELLQRLEIKNGVVLAQRTPLRVLHRRVQMVRKRCVYGMRVVDLISPNFFVLDLEAQAGTYIKEFVHGDHGRTVPSVAGLLGCEVDILQLDVTRVDADVEG